MRRLLPLLLVLWAAPVAAQDTIVEVNGVKAGIRRNTDGTVDDLIWGRDPKKLWLGKGLRARRAPRVFPRDAEPLDGLAPGLAAADLPPGPPTVTADGAAVQDVLIVYTPAAASARGGEAAMPAFAELLRSITQTGYDRSLVAIQHRIVGVRRVEYVEVNGNTDLSRLQSPSDGFMDQIHQWRNEVGADLVAFIGRGYAGQGLCGLGYRPATVTTAFTLIDEGCAAGNLSYMHEIGHNQGARHDPMTECAQATCPGDNFGHGWPGYRSVMAYPSVGGERIAQFSNPNVMHSGFPTGIVGSRDNARTVNASALVISQFRSTVAPLPPAPRLGGRPILKE